MFQVGNFESHQVVKPSRLHHVLHLLRQGSDLRIFLLLSDMVQQVVKYVAYHLNLLLALEVIIYCTCPLIAHELVTSVGFHPLQVAQDILDTRS